MADIRCNACNCTWEGVPRPSLEEDCPQCGKADTLRPDFESEREEMRLIIADAARCRKSSAWGQVSIRAQEFLDRSGPDTERRRA